MNVDSQVPPPRTPRLNASSLTRAGRATPRRMALGLIGGLAAVSLGAGMAPALEAEAGNRYEVSPGSPVLISEIANGGAGASTTANRVANKNFIELSNFSESPVDISGWKIYRCGQTGGGYGPQTVVPADTILAPGAQFTTSRAGSGYATDASYETSLHDFGYGAFIEDATGQRRDAVGIYHPDIASDCETDGVNLDRQLDHRLDESFQRVSATGNVTQDWIIAPRTVGAPNATAESRTSIDNGLRFTEIANAVGGSSTNQYVELSNFGTEAVDMSGFSLFRCGENSTAYVQIPQLPAGSVVAPGESFVISAAKGTQPAGGADLSYDTAMHWRDFGVMLLTPQQEIVDRVGVYNNRNSPCADGAPVKNKADHFQNEVLVRVTDTGNNAADFALTTAGTPSTHVVAPVVAAPAKSAATDVAISEIAPAGAAGTNDEFFELANYGTSPVSLAGWSAYRCTGTGQGSATPQIADLGAITLAPGQTYLATPEAAPAELREKANGLYATGLNETGYGIYIMDSTGATVDAMASYDVVVDQFTPCRMGQEARNYSKSDQGQSYQRAQHTGDNEHDFSIAATRTPGELNDVVYVDPTEPLPGELEPATVSTNNVPGTPKLTLNKGADLAATVTGTDDGGTNLTLAAQAAELKDGTGVVVRAGTSPAAVPATLAIAGEKIVDGSQALATAGSSHNFPFQRFEIGVTAAEETNFIWSGTTAARNEIQMLGWDATASKWSVLTTAVPSADGDITLNGTVPASWVEKDKAHVLVIDGPRTQGGLLDEIGVTDQSFTNPGSYDFALNHMTDTQFYAEGFQDVFRQMSSWVVANANARKIAYNSHTGDIIENWIAGNNSHERADREFTASKKIMSMINDANIPNGILPGNHDNFWGHDNTKYNEYFPASMYQDKPWFGETWTKDDNAAHSDFFSHDGVDFLVLSLPYRSSGAQQAWASAQAKAHPNHNVIIATHAYLNTAGTRDTVDARYTSSAQEVWDTVVAPNENVFLVLGGHFHGVVTNYADPVTGEQTDATELARNTFAIGNVGNTGRTVVEMLADYQGYRSTVPAPRGDILDRDTGFQRLLQFDLDANLMAVNAYSPSLDSFEAWKYDEPNFRGDAARYDAGDDEFVAQVSLIRATELTSSSWAVTGAFKEFAQGELAVGGEQSITLAAGTGAQLWTVSLTDADGNVSRSAPQLLAALTVTEPSPSASASVSAAPSTPASSTADPAPTAADPSASVTGPSTSSDPVAGSDDLASTGAQAGMLLIGGLALLLAGVGTLLMRARRSSTHG